MEVLLALGDPASQRRQMLGGPSERWWLGEDLPAPRAVLLPALQGWLEAEGVRALAQVCQERTEALYERLAAAEADGDPLFFAEKYWAASPVPALMRELYPNARELVLVRDFRDMLCSMRAFDERRNVVGFGRQHTASDLEHVAALGRRVEQLLASWQQRRGSALLVRYEDLVSRPDDTIADVLAHLGVDGGSNAVQSMQAALAASDTSRHRTTSSSKASIGRWRTDLPEELLEASRRAFGHALDVFGYTETS
jgi:Sulfotransferase family